MTSDEGGGGCGGGSGAGETKNALWRREEQLMRWQSSDTNKVSPVPRSAGAVRFQDGCVFLAACSSGDTEEIVRLLNSTSADINTSNVDGLTALHQACIDDNLPMVKFLVSHGAHVNACDNEGWTSLHATASCGFVEVARYLIENGASLDAVNNDGELVIDLAEGKDMELLLMAAMEKQGIDAEAARNEEEEIMLHDANEWLNSGTLKDVPHPKTGATALHIAAAKGYIKVMKVLLEAGADIHAQDLDGWTPMHAAAHWGQDEACKMLVENLCNLDITNNVGQTALDVVDPEIESVVEELKKKQALMSKSKEITTNGTVIREVSPPKPRRPSLTSVVRKSGDEKASLVMKNMEEERTSLVQLFTTVEDDLSTFPENREEELPTAAEDRGEGKRMPSTDKSKTQLKVNGVSSQSRVSIDSAENQTVDLSSPPPPPPSSLPPNLLPPATLPPASSPTTLPPAKPPTTLASASSLSLITPPLPSTQPPPMILSVPGRIQAEIITRAKDVDMDASTTSRPVENEISKKIEDRAISDRMATTTGNETTAANIATTITSNIITSSTSVVAHGTTVNGVLLRPIKVSVCRAVSAPIIATTSSTAPASVTTTTTVTARARQGLGSPRLLDSSLYPPSAWRASLRKTGSSTIIHELGGGKVVGERGGEGDREGKREEENGRVTADRSSSVELRSARGDATSLTSKRPISIATSDDTEFKNRFNELTSRFAARLGTTSCGTGVITTTTGSKISSNLFRLIPPATSLTAVLAPPGQSMSRVSDCGQSVGRSSFIQSVARSADFSQSVLRCRPDLTTSASSVVSSVVDSVGGSLASPGTLTAHLVYSQPSVQLLRRRQTDQATTTIATTTVTSHRSSVGGELSREKDTASATGAVTRTSSSPGLGLLSSSTTAALAGLANTRRSFEIPKRDEEKEVERKARAKRARETRRSTQGVNKEDLDKAEECLRAARVSASTVEAPHGKTSTDTILTACKPTPLDSATVFTSVTGLGARSQSLTGTTSLTTALASTATAVTSSLMSTSSRMSSFRSKYLQEKADAEARIRAEETQRNKDLIVIEQQQQLVADTLKDDDSSIKLSVGRSRRKREGRPLTGRIIFDPSAIDGEEKENEKLPVNKTDSWTSAVRLAEPVGRVGGLPKMIDRSAVTNQSPSRPGYGSSSSSSSTSSVVGKEIDYKKLYEDEKLTNEQLRKELKQVQQDSANCRSQLERARTSGAGPNGPSSSSVPSTVTVGTSDSSDTAPQRLTFTERRTLERKITELEQELKNSETTRSELRADNQRLKDENGALIRVISKLSK